MKHLKKFNESLTTDEFEELKDFCETSLAYLLDEDLDISFRQNLYNTRVTLYIGDLSMLDHLFKWNDVKDYYIPFLQMLVRRYELGSKMNGVRSSSFMPQVYFDCEFSEEDTSPEDCINDNLGKIDNIYAISIYVKSKKV